MINRWWYFGITILVVLLLADVALLQARLGAMDLVSLNREVANLREEVGRLKNWEAARADTEDVGIKVSPSPVATSKPISAPLRPAEPDYAGQREVYVPLGSGSTKSLDWVDVGGQTYIDTSQYRIKEAYFEASLRSNSGKVWTRLMNKNENEYVGGSEISGDTSMSTLIRSGKIFLPRGNKLYGFQARSETQQDVFVENAKVRLIVE